MTDFETYVFMDLESTGLLTPDHNPKITELCFQAVHRHEMVAAHKDRRLPRVVNKINLTFDPGEALQPGVSELTGLNTDNLCGHSKLDELSVVVMDAFIRRLASPVCLLAHNGFRFDYPLLQAELSQLNTSFSIPNLQCVDTLDLFRALDWSSPWNQRREENAVLPGNQVVAVANGNSCGSEAGNVDNHDDKDKENAETGAVVNNNNNNGGSNKSNDNNSTSDIIINSTGTTQTSSARNGNHDNSTSSSTNPGKDTSGNNTTNIPYKPKTTVHRRSFDASPVSERRKSASGKIENVGSDSSPVTSPSSELVHSSSCDSQVTTSNKDLKRKAPSTPLQGPKTFENKSIKRRLFEKYSKEREAKEKEEKEKREERPKPRSSPENLTATSTCVTRSGGRKYLAATLERQGTIILWHDHFNEDFFREHLEIADKRADDPPLCDSPTDKSKLFRNSMTTTTTVTQDGSVDCLRLTTKTVTDFSVRKGKLVNGLNENSGSGVLHGLLVAEPAPELIAVDRKEPVDLSLNSRTVPSPRNTLGLNTSQNQQQQQGAAHDPPQQSDMAARRRREMTKTSYGLRELYKRICGQYPVKSHTAEDDCVALMEIVCRELPSCRTWIKDNHREFARIQPMY